MPRDHTDGRPGFRIHSQSWYASSVPLARHKDGAFDEIMVGFYDDDGVIIGGGGTSGEFSFVWYILGDLPTIRLECYSDGWSSLIRIPRLLNLMSDIDTDRPGRRADMNVDRFAEMLTSIGIMDMTNRTPK